MKKLIGIVLITAVFLVLLYLYEVFPDQRAILIFGSILGATSVARATP